jgi:hypothetical protein
MTIETVVQEYFAAWNAHDPVAVEACFTDGGTFEDPTTPGPISGSAIGDAVRDFAKSFPDNSLPIDEIDVVSERKAFVEFRLCGTNSGDSLLGPATNATVDFPVVDRIVLAPDGRIESVRGCWDLAAFFGTMGLQVNPSPQSVPGLIDMGIGVRVTTGRTDEPGCFTVTSVDTEGLDANWVNTITPAIVEELMGTSGYLGSCFVVAGNRHYTFTAWTDAEAVKALHSTQHREAMRAVMTGERCTRIMTSLWAPLKMNTTKTKLDGDERPTADHDPGPWL